MSGATEFVELAAKRGIFVEATGSGRPLLFLHGGGGLKTISPFAKTLSKAFSVLLPTHPGFEGTPMVPEIASVQALAETYKELVEAAGLDNVIVMGSSVGGWVAAEMAVLQSRALAVFVFIDAVGIAVDGETVLDTQTTPPSEIPKFSFYQPEKFRVDLSRMTLREKQIAEQNAQALAVYSGSCKMQDPSLLGRLATIDAPSLVVWGHNDGVVSPAYGRAFANAIPNSSFEVLNHCGHLPSLEQPEVLHALLLLFLRERSSK